jgi:hypothetical protein
VLFITHCAAYGWALSDGDWLRVRPMFWQAVPTALLFMLLPLLHPADLRPDAGSALIIYYLIKPPPMAERPEEALPFRRALV